MGSRRSAGANGPCRISIAESLPTRQQRRARRSLGACAMYGGLVLSVSYLVLEEVAVGTCTDSAWYFRRGLEASVSDTFRDGWCD